MICQVSSLHRYVRRISLFCYFQRFPIPCSKDGADGTATERVKEAAEGFGKNSDVRVIISGESFAKHGIFVFEDRTDSYEVRYKYLHTSFYLTIFRHHSDSLQA